MTALWRLRLLWSAAVLVAAAGAGNAQSPDVDPQKLAQARQAAGALGKALGEQLVAALSAGGPAAAVQVCSQIAPDLAKQISGEQGMTVRRTALRLRNPANAPDAFERKVLEEFVAKMQSGADPKSLEHAEVVRENGAEVIRYMKAIPMAAEPCLTCHGSNLEADVKDVIARLYPDDKATGFKPGELRGAFSITMPPSGQ